MRNVIFAFVFLFLVSGCGATLRGREADVAMLEQVFENVAEKLNNLGFELDLEEVSVTIKNEKEMEAIYQSLYFESTKSNNFYPSFGPKYRKRKTDEQNGRLAFYDPNSKTIVVKESAMSILTEGYLAHELVHAYQDQKWGFKEIWKPYYDDPSREMFNIINYLIEGHAELVRQAYEQNFTKSEKVRDLLSGKLSKIVDSECMFCHEKIYADNLPYRLGLRFLADLYKQGGWDLVEGVFTDLPTSTEQILHPDKLGKDHPTDVFLPEWKNNRFHAKLASDSIMGEAHLFFKLISIPLSSSESFSLASGWDGDKFHAYKTNDGEDILVWRIAFDRDEDAKKLQEILDAKHAIGKRLLVGNVLDWVISDNQKIIDALSLFLSQKPYVKEKSMEDMKSTSEQEKQSRKDAKILNSPMYASDEFLDIGAKD